MHVHLVADERARTGGGIRSVIREIVENVVSEVLVVAGRKQRQDVLYLPGAAVSQQDRGPLYIADDAVVRFVDQSGPAGLRPGKEAVEMAASLAVRIEGRPVHRAGIVDLHGHHYPALDELGIDESAQPPDAEIDVQARVDECSKDRRSFEGCRRCRPAEKTARASEEVVDGSAGDRHLDLGRRAPDDVMNACELLRPVREAQGGLLHEFTSGSDLARVPIAPADESPIGGVADLAKGAGTRTRLLHDDRPTTVIGWHFVADHLPVDESTYAGA